MLTTGQPCYKLGVHIVQASAPSTVTQQTEQLKTLMAELGNLVQLLWAWCEGSQKTERLSSILSN